MKFIEHNQLLEYREDSEAKNSFELLFKFNLYKIIFLWLSAYLVYFFISLVAFEYENGAVGVIGALVLVVAAVLNEALLFFRNEKMKNTIPKSKLTGKPFDVFLLKREANEVAEKWVYVSREEKIYFTVVYSKRRNFVPFK